MREKASALLLLRVDLVLHGSERRRTSNFDPLWEKSLRDLVARQRDLDVLEGVRELDAEELCDAICLLLERSRELRVIGCDRGVDRALKRLYDLTAEFLACLA